MSPPAESLTILVVDDQASSRVAIAAMLDNLGHRVVEADTAAWAMTMFARHTPDLVLLDVEMPDASGYEVARQLRAVVPASPGRDRAAEVVHRVAGLDDDRAFCLPARRDALEPRDEKDVMAGVVVGALAGPVGPAVGGHVDGHDATCPERDRICCTAVFVSPSRQPICSAVS
jgi:CheY-like chemotaxis protein